MRRDVGKNYFVLNCEPFLDMGERIVPTIPRSPLTLKALGFVDCGIGCYH